MEQLKVRKKDSLITNIVLYLGLSFLFLCLQHAYRYHLSPFSLVYIRKSFELFWYVALPTIFSTFLIWRHHHLSVLTYSICIFLVGFKVVEGLFIEFNKIIVIALFFYVVISYFLYQLLSHYLNLASINSNYSRNDLFEPLLTRIPCLISFQQTSIPGFLTNWDFEGCFVKMDSPVIFPGAVQISVHFQGREFVHQGEVVAETLDLLGVGIKFEKKQKDLRVFNWSEFIELIDELGYRPERLR